MSGVDDKMEFLFIVVCEVIVIDVELILFVWNGFDVGGLKGLFFEGGVVWINGFGFGILLFVGLILIFSFNKFKFCLILLLEFLKVIYFLLVEFEVGCWILVVLVLLLNLIYDLLVSKFSLFEVNDIGGIIEVVFFLVV